MHSQPTNKEAGGITGHPVKQFCSLQMVIYNTIILYAQRDTFLCYLWNDKKWRSLLWNFTWQKWHKNLLLLNEYKQMNLHFLYITPTLLEGSWYRSLLCQHYPMLYTMSMKRNTLHFSSWSNMNWTLNIWEEVAWKEHGKNIGKNNPSVREKKNKSETVNLLKISNSRNIVEIRGPYSAQI